MPASDKLCDRMREIFRIKPPVVPEGETAPPLERPDPRLPLEYLLAKGFKVEDGQLVGPTPDHVPTAKQSDCIQFLAAEQQAKK